MRRVLLLSRNRDRKPEGKCEREGIPLGENMGRGRGPNTADSYIGSLISLTSKSEIRYEGILYTVDTENSNIALQNGVISDSGFSVCVLGFGVKLGCCREAC